jgi:hypothetical protein
LGTCRATVGVKNEIYETFSKAAIEFLKKEREKERE